MLQKQESTEADSATQRLRGRGRSRFSQTPDYAEVAESSKEVTTKRTSELPRRRNEAPRSRSSERPPPNRRTYEVEEAVDEPPRKSRTRVITESRFEAKTASSPPQLFQPAPTTAPLGEIPLEAISRTFTTIKVEKTTEAVSEPASASSVDPSTTKEEVPATEPISEETKITSEAETIRARTESTTPALARKGRVNIRLRGGSTESTTAPASSKGRAKGRTGRRHDTKSEEVAQQTAPVLQVVHPGNRSNRGGRRPELEAKEETAPIRNAARGGRKLTVSESRRTAEVKAPLDLTTEGRQDERRREVRGYSSSRSNTVTHSPEIASSSRANIVRSTRKPKHERHDVDGSLRTDVRRQDRERSPSSTERSIRNPPNNGEKIRIKSRTPTTTSAPTASRTTTADNRSRNRFRPGSSILDEENFEVLPLFESNPATVRITPPSTTIKRKYENEIPNSISSTTTTTSRGTTSRLTTPKIKAKREEEVTINTQKPVVKETVQVSQVKEVTTKRKVVRRKKLDNGATDNTRHNKPVEGNHSKSSTMAERRQGSTERTTKRPLTTRNPTEKPPKPPLEYYDRSLFPSSTTEFPFWDTTNFREKMTIEPEHTSAWIGFDKQNRFYADAFDRKNIKTESPKEDVLNRGRSFDYKNEIISDVPVWHVSYQFSDVPTTPLKRESTTHLPTTERRGNEKEKVTKKTKTTEAPLERRTTERYHKTTSNAPGTDSYEHRRKENKSKSATDRVRATQETQNNRQKEKQHFKTTAAPEKRTSERVPIQEVENSSRFRQNQQFKSTVIPNKKNFERIPFQEYNDYRQTESQQSKTTALPDRVRISEPTANQRQKQQIKTNGLPEKQTSENADINSYDFRQKDKQKIRIPVYASTSESQQKEKHQFKTTTTVAPERRTTAERLQKTSSTETYNYRPKEKQVRTTTESYDRRGYSRATEVTEKRKIKPTSGPTPKEHSRQTKAAVFTNDGSGNKYNERKLYSEIRQEQRLSTLSTEIPEKRSTTRITSTTTVTTPATAATTPSTPSRPSTLTYATSPPRTTRLYTTPEISVRQATPTDRQRVKEEAKVTVSQVVTKTRGSKKSTSEEKRKEAGSKEEEEIDESDNYPEPFKALIQAKKEKDHTPNQNSKVGSKNNNDSHTLKHLGNNVVKHNSEHFV